MRPLQLLVLGLALSLGTVGCTISTPEPHLAGQDVHLTLMHASDLHSRFFPYFFAPGQIDRGLGIAPKPGQNLAVVGGIARIGTVIKCVRGFRTDPECQRLEPLIGPPAARSLHFDSGDIFQGAPVFNVFNGEVEMRAMTNLGLSAMVIGNHEFDKGAVNFELQLARFGGFPMLAANYYFTDPEDPTQPKLAKIIPPYQIFNVNGVKVGVIGMANLSSIQGIIEGGNSLGIRPIKDTEALKRMVEVVRPQVDVLLVTSHLGLAEDEEVAEAEAEAARDQNNSMLAQSGIDVILGGHLHIVFNPPKDLPHFDPESGAPAGHTVLCHSGAFAKYVGRLDLIVHMPTPEEEAAGKRAEVKAYTYKVIPITDEISDDPELVNMLEPYEFKMNRFLNLAQVYALVPCPKDAQTCPKTLRNDPEGGDSQLGNLVATSMRLRRRVEADFALTNSLGIRTDFESGALTLEQMYNVFPFENTITTMFLSGSEVQQMLDFVSIRSSERGCRTQAQVSGIYFDMLCSPGNEACRRLCAPDDPNCVPPPCATNIHLGDRCRMPDGSFDGTACKPLEEFGEYRVAVNDFIAQGGSGFAVLKRNTTKFNTGISLRDSLIDFVRTMPDRCDPAEYKNVTGVTCRGTKGELYDCTSDCCCHDDESGPLRCSDKCQAFAECAANRSSPELYDYSNVSCLGPTIEAKDGRILPIVGAN